MIYLLCYIAVGFLLTNTDKYGDKINKIIISLVIAILTLLAAFREQTIGIDVRGYVLTSFKASESIVNIRGFLYYMSSRFEWGYSILVFICTKIFHSLNCVLFGIALLINSGVIIGLYRVRKNISLSFAVLAYCFLFYQETYNMMRQWMAMSIIIFGIVYIYERKFFKYCVTVAVAILFHTSAIIGLLLYFIAEIVRKKRSTKWQILIILATLFCVINLGAITEYLTGQGWLDVRYLYYVTGNDLAFSFSMFIVRIPPIILSAVLYKYMDRSDELHKVWFLFLLIDMIISQLHSVMDFAQRIGSYFTIAQMFELSYAAKIGNLTQKTFAKVGVLLFLLMYWYVYYIYFNFGNTYPYIVARF